jgi:hypothetical protein
MKASTSRNAAALIFVAAGLLALGDGCDGGREGDRCNPLLSHDECGNGLSCQQPSTCAENYCCPSPASASSNPYCNGAACPPADGGSDAAADGGDEAAAPADGGAG